jgi:hypothetical protein
MAGIWLREPARHGPYKWSSTTTFGVRICWWASVIERLKPKGVELHGQGGQLLERRTNMPKIPSLVILSFTGKNRPIFA